MPRLKEWYGENVESSWLVGNTRIRIWWHPSYWSIHSFKHGGRRATCFGPIEIYTGG